MLMESINTHWEQQYPSKANVCVFYFIYLANLFKLLKNLKRHKETMKLVENLHFHLLRW